MRNTDGYRRDHSGLCPEDHGSPVARSIAGKNVVLKHALSEDKERPSAQLVKPYVKPLYASESLYIPILTFSGRT